MMLDELDHSGGCAAARPISPQPAPENSAHSEEILPERLGLSSGQIAVLIDAGTVRQA
jgi:hypothetical protein